MPQATTPLLRTLLLFTALFACSTHASAASYVVKHCAELEGQSVPASVIGTPADMMAVPESTVIWSEGDRSLPGATPPE